MLKMFRLLFEANSVKVSYLLCTAQQTSCLSPQYDTSLKKVTCTSCDTANGYILNSDDSMCYGKFVLSPFLL